MEMIKISIIAPVYNAEKYLSQCIDSVLSQTVTDFELLLIDDGSSDRSGNICDEYARKDFRVQVFHKRNGGVSSARNLGIDKAQGEWITFVDSDDRLENTFLEQMLAKALELKVDAVFCNCYYVYENETIQKSIYTENTVEDGEGMLKRFLIRFGTRSELWGKIIKKKYLNHRLKENVKIGEDFLYLIELYYSHDCKTAIITDYLYYYRQLETSAMNNNNLAFHNKQLLRECLQFIQQHQEIEVEHPHEKSVFIIRLVSAVIKRDFRKQTKDAFLVKLLKENYENAVPALLRSERRLLRSLFIHPLLGWGALKLELGIRKYVFKERKLE
jgi:glycosyltransferase involved in cell wall biosynthesis